MAREKLATAAIIVCMVAAVSTLPAMLIAGSIPQPVVNNYYNDNTTNNTTNNTTVNTTLNVNGTFPIRTCHFVNVTATILHASISTNTIIYSIPLVNRTIVTSLVAFSFNLRAPGAGGSGFSLNSLLNNKTIDLYGAGSTFPTLNGHTVIGEFFYSIWNNPYQSFVYPNASTYVLDICGYHSDVTWTNINVSVAIWWETW